MRTADDHPLRFFFFFFEALSRRRPVLYRAPERKVFATPRRRSSLVPLDALFVRATAPNRDRAKHESMLLLSAGSRSTPVSASVETSGGTRAFVVRRCRLSGLSEAQTATRGRARPSACRSARPPRSRAGAPSAAPSRCARRTRPLDAGADEPADARAETDVSRVAEPRRRLRSQEVDLNSGTTTTTTTTSQKTTTTTSRKTTT